MFKAAFFFTFMIYCASTERISNTDSPTWDRSTTTEDYQDLSDSDEDSPETRARVGRPKARPRDRLGSSASSGHKTDHKTAHKGSSVTVRPHRVTYSWERDQTPAVGRVSHLDHNTHSPYVQAGKTRSPYVTWGSGHRVTIKPGSGSFWDRTTSRPSGLRSSSYNRNEAYIRIVAELKKLTNDKGMTMDGSKCDTFGQCDPVFKVFLDTDRPNMDFPGAREAKHYTEIYHVDDNNSPDVRNGTVKRDVCGIPFMGAVLRVLVEDKDGLSANDVINNFDCKIEGEPGTDEYSMWHDGVCSPRKQGDKMQLTFRCKVYVIPESECNSRS